MADHQDTGHAHLNKNKQPLKYWLLLILFLGIMAWCTRYWMSAEFGLYEDDITFIPGAIEADFAGIVEMVTDNFSTLAEQGRPFMWSWVVFFAHAGWHLGGLQGMYFLAFSVWMLNITLFVLLLRRINESFFFGVVGGLAYVLFSADTTQAFLFNAYGLQTAITFLLIAFHIYLSNHKLRWFAYLFLVLVMFNYETPYWLFLAAPLLTKGSTKETKKNLLINTIIVFMIFILVYLLRIIAGESRAVGMSLSEMLLTPINHMLIGPFVGFGTYFIRPVLMLKNFSLTLGLLVILGGGLSFSLLMWAFYKSAIPSVEIGSIKKGWRFGLDPRIHQELRLALAGIIMLVFSYPLTIILRPIAISGRESRVHLAAVVGAAILFSSLLTLTIRLIHGKRLRYVIIMIVSLILGFSFAFGFTIQSDYQRAWDVQKNFWRDLLSLIPDVEDGTAILVEPSGLEDVLQIDANTWNLPRVLPQLFVFPDSWEQPPRAYRLVSNWQNQIVRLPGYFTVDVLTSYSPTRTYGNFLQSKAIFISTANGDLARRSEPLPLGEMIPLKPVGANVLQDFATRPLYDLLIRDE